jgi:hypothetical protein
MSRAMWSWARAVEVGHELVRNWRIGCELAGVRRFVRVNMSPAPLDTGAETGDQAGNRDEGDRPD